MKKELKDLTDEEKTALVDSGMMWEFYPEYAPEETAIGKFMRMVTEIGDRARNGKNWMVAGFPDINSGRYKVFVDMGVDTAVGEDTEIMINKEQWIAYDKQKQS